MLMMSFAQTLIGFGTMVYPVIVHFLMENYGFRGMTLICAAINCHAIFGMLTMHPVEWHSVYETKPCKSILIRLLPSIFVYSKFYHFQR